MILAIDTMNGDLTPEQIVRGVILAAQEDRSGDEYVLIGQKNILDKLLSSLLKEDLPISYQHAYQKIEEDENPVRAVISKQEASICVAARMVKEGKAQALISVGNVAAQVAASRYILKLIPGVKRPALAVHSPSVSGDSVLIDAGANINSTSDDMFHFAELGIVYAKVILGIENPTVGLLSVGTEDTKGNELNKETFIKFKESSLNFYGNMEGKDIFSNKVDVIVSSGFIGHVAWKVGESLVSNVQKILMDEMDKHLTSRIGRFFIKSTLKAIERKAHIDEHGGAPLLGVDGISIVTNPTSSQQGILKAVQLAKRCYESKVNDRISMYYKSKITQGV